MRKPIAISVAVAMVAIAIPAAALAFGVPRPAVGPVQDPRGTGVASP